MAHITSATMDVILFAHQPNGFNMRSIYIPKYLLTAKLIDYFDQMKKSIVEKDGKCTNPKIIEILQFMRFVCDGSPAHYDVFVESDCSDKDNTLDYDMPEWYNESILCFGFQDNFDEESQHDCNNLKLQFEEMKKPRTLRNININIVDAYLYYDYLDNCYLIQ